MDDNGHGLREELWGLGRVGMGDRREERERICPQGEKVGQRAKQKHWFHEGRENRGWRRRKGKYTTIAGVH